MVKCDEKRLTRRQKAVRRRLRQERVLLKLILNVPQGLREFYENANLLLDENLETSTKETIRYNLLTDKEFLEYIDKVINTFDLSNREDLDEKINEFEGYLISRLEDDNNFYFSEKINALIRLHPVVGLLYPFWKHVQDLLPINYECIFTSKEKEIIKFLLFKGDMAEAAKKFDIPRISTTNEFKNILLSKTCSNSVLTALRKIHLGSLTKKQTLPCMEIMRNIQCKIIAENIATNKKLVLAEHMDEINMSFILEGAIEFHYAKHCDSINDKEKFILELIKASELKKISPYFYKKYFKNKILSCNERIEYLYYKNRGIDYYAKFLVRNR